MLVSPILPNSDSMLWGTHQDSKSKLEKMRKNGIEFANMIAVHRYLLGTKKYQDLIGNNVYHPNDFLVRVYAQYVSALLIRF
jgi:hypothetical protein